ncbi:MAG: hypothetical protein ACE5ID_12000, partial [Acidobacteriota bacterium]
MHPALLQVPQRFRLQVLFLAMALMAGGLSAASPLPSSPASSRVHSLPTGTRPPNLILITVASVRADRFPGRHPGRHVFPRLEQMAQGGFFTSRGRT